MDEIRKYLGLDERGKAIVSPDGKLSGGRAKRLVHEAIDLLRDKSWGLPDISISNIASVSESGIFFFFLLVWLDRLPESSHKFGNLDDEGRRRLVGAITTLAWFRERPADCLKKLWEDLLSLDNAGRIEFFWQRGMLRECLISGERRALKPPLPPSCLQNAVQTVITAPGFEAGDGVVWTQNWDPWSQSGSFKDALDSSAKKWLISVGLLEPAHLPGIAQGFGGYIFGMRELLHYAQRQQIKNWYPKYDPASPDQLEDTDRPWDYDHIFPSAFDVPAGIKAWVGSIANLRVWPLEANRSHGDCHPAAKLGGPIPHEQLHPYKLQQGEEIRRASQITESDWARWQAVTPNGAMPVPKTYLARPIGEGALACRPELVRVLVSRLISIYSDWYTELRIGELFDKIP